MPRIETSFTDRDIVRPRGAPNLSKAYRVRIAPEVLGPAGRGPYHQRAVEANADFDPGAARTIGEALKANLRRALKVREEAVRDMLVALLAEGHVLIEDHPGVGKTALARSLARSVRAEFSRIQCTADMLPADVTGTMIFNQRESAFEFHPGPIFANVVLVDEINRASPKTQSGLLESMQERRVTVDQQTHELARPFLIVATQNPAEYAGTYPLPEAQLDRFMIRIELGYPGPEDEAEMLAGHASVDLVSELEPVADLDDVRRAQICRRRRPRQRRAAPLRRRPGRGDPQGPAARARREPAGGADAVPCGEGDCGAGRPRPRPSRRRPGARPGRCSRIVSCSLPACRSRSGRWSSPTRSRPSRRSEVAGAATALRLGIALVAGGVFFAAPVVLLPGAALILLVGGCTLWARLGVRRRHRPAQRHPFAGHRGRAASRSSSTGSAAGCR